jgi:signal transduction histidine kinase
MRERVTSAGGLLEVGPTPDGTFRVHAELPAAARRGDEPS